MSWTDDRVELLRKLWAEGLSASQVAARLGGITRNAVIGKVHRLGLEGRARAGQGGKRAEAETEEAPGPEAGAGSAARNIEADLASVVPLPSQAVGGIPALPDQGKLTLLNLTEQTCKWPIGDPGTAGFHFCGQRAELGLPYCAAHARIAYQPAQDRRRDRRLVGL